MMQNPSGVGPLPQPPAADPQQWMMIPQQHQPQQAQGMMPQQFMPQQQQPVMQAMPPQQVMQPQQGMQPRPYMHPQPLMQPQQGYYSPQQQQDETRSIWFGDLQYWMDETYLFNCFGYTGEVVSVKVIRNKLTGNSEGYGFIEFATHATAEKILHSYNGSHMPQTEQPFRLNWATFGTNERRPEMGGGDHSIFVGDLASDVTDQLLLETFQARYPSVKGAKVVIDTLTGRSKGYGFVRFGDELERTRAMTEMNGVYCLSRPMRIGTATPKKLLGLGQQGNPKASYQGSTYGAPASQNFAYDTDPNNTTVFVGGLGQAVTDEDLRHVFSPYGEIVYVKIPIGKGCGFVQYSTRASAEEALQKLHGTTIGQQTIRLSWGRSPVNKQRQSASGWGQPQQDSSQWNGGYYGYGQGQGQSDGQGYDGYGFSAPQDGGAYGYGNYQGYGAYPQQSS